MQRKSGKKSTKRNRKPSQPTFFTANPTVKKQKVITPEQFFDLGTHNISQADFRAAVNNFMACETLIRTDNRVDLSADDAILAMQALDNASWLLENDLVKRPIKKNEREDDYHESCLQERRNKLVLLGQRAEKMIQRAGEINEIEYQLAKLRMTFNRNDMLWDDILESKELMPKISKQFLVENLQPLCMSLRDMIDSQHDIDNKHRNMYLSRLARAAINLGAAYIYVADHKKAITAYLLALNLLARMSIKDNLYAHHLYVVFYTLSDHILEEEFSIFMFMMKLVRGRYNPTFHELAAKFVSIDTGPQNQNPLKMACWYMCLDLIKARLDAGNLPDHQCANYHGDFPKTPFWDALNNTDTQKRFNEMYDCVKLQVQQNNNEYLIALSAMPRQVRLPPELPLPVLPEGESSLSPNMDELSLSPILGRQGFFSVSSDGGYYGWTRPEEIFGELCNPEDFSSLVISDDEFEEMMGIKKK
jgi:tetratricopeptide (TPR) repeat protein